MLANRPGADYGRPTKIIPYVMAWNGIVMNHHKKYTREISITDSIEIYPDRKEIETRCIDEEAGS